MPDFVVILDASSAVRLDVGESVQITEIPTASGLATARWFTYHSEEGFDVPVPRELWVEVSGPAESLDEACNEFLDVGRALTPYVALTANAAIDDPQLLLAYDATPEATSHKFVQALRPSTTGQFRSSRRLDVGLVGPTLVPILGSREHDRLHRAVVHYSEALKAWGPGSDLRTVLHLWMATEAMTKAALRIELERTGLTQDQLVAAWGTEPKQLDSEVRSRVLMHGDYATYAEARSISDAAEHSYQPFAGLHPRAAAIRDNLATHVRSSLLELADVAPETRQALLSEGFKHPRESFPMTRLFRGWITGDGPLAADGRPYPWVDWTSKIVAVSKNQDGSYRVSPEEVMTPRIGPSVAMTDTSFELWGPRQDSARFTEAPSGAEVTTSDGEGSGAGTE